MQDIKNKGTTTFQINKVVMEYNKDQIIFAVSKLFSIEDQNKVFKELNLEDFGSFRVYLAILKLSKR